MMKLNLNYLCFSLMILMAACSPSNSDVVPAPLRLQVMAEDFSPLGETATRVADEGYSTSFTDGDKIGVTVIKNGKIVDGVNNICFTYNASTGKWTASDESLSLYYYQDVTYIAYYPYSSAMDGITGKQQIIDAFTPKTEQSTYAAYTASDLMIAEGKPDKEKSTLVLPFAHCMSLLEIRVADRCYVTTDGNFEYAAPMGEVPTLNVTVNGASCSAYRYNSMSFRLLTKPEASITFELAFKTNYGDDFTRNETLTSTVQGKYTRYTYQYGATILRDLQVGDFYYQDGSIVPYDDTPPVFTTNPCIGIVFYTGRHAKDVKREYTYKGTGYPMTVHGYVVALVNANDGNATVWGPWANNQTYIMETSFHTAENTSQFDYEGYYNTFQIKNTAAAKWPDWDFNVKWPAAYHTTDGYESKVSSSVKSSGWFFPSAGQLYDCFVADMVTTSLSKAQTIGFTVDLFNKNGEDDVFYPSTEGKYSGNDRVVWVRPNKSVNFYVKDESHRIRSVLAF